MGGVQQAVNTTGGLAKPCLSEPWRGKVSRTVCPEDLKLSLGIALSGAFVISTSLITDYMPLVGDLPLGVSFKSP